MNLLFVKLSFILELYATLSENLQKKNKMHLFALKEHCRMYVLYFMFLCIFAEIKKKNKKKDEEEEKRKIRIFENLVSLSWK